MCNICKNWDKGSHTFFFLFLGATILAIIAFYACHSSHAASIECIISCQKEQSRIMDSTMTAFYQQLEEFSQTKENALKSIVSDSILAKLPKLKSKDAKNIVSYVESAIVASTNEFLQKDAMVDYEALVLSNRLNQLQSDTKSLLELEMNKIQNEHEVLGIWAAVLTIVFLIFSFYSLVKTDDMVKKGEDGLDKLTQIKKDAESKLDTIKEKGDSQITNIDHKAKLAMENFNAIFNNKIAELDDRVDRTQRMYKTNFDRFIQDVGNSIIDKQQEITKMHNDATSDIIEIESKKNNLLAELNMLEVRLSILEQKMDSNNFTINESDKEVK